MPRGVYIRKNTKKSRSSQSAPVATNANGNDVTGQITIAAFVEMPWWEKLNLVEQSTVVSEGQALAGAMLSEGQAKMEVGKHLAAVKAVLEPHNLFQKFLRRFTKYSIPTAYRYMRRYENAIKSLPAAVVTAAMVRGIDIAGATDAKPFGIYTSAIKKVRMPRKATPAEANKFLDRIEKVRAEARAEGPQLVTGDPELSKREVVRFFTLKYDRLPTNRKTRDKFAREVVALIMAKAGLDAQTITPMAVPEDYIVHRGRPRLASA